MSAWDVIPSGTTVTGLAGFDGHQSGSTSGEAITIDLPGVAPVALTSTKVNFSASSPGASDGDATCTGTSTTPTAPAGKVCLYLIGGYDTTTFNASAFFLADRSFTVRWTPIGPVNGEETMYASWAYTAP